MGINSADGQAPKAKPTRLNWHQERFVEYYVDNGGNATAAYIKAYPMCSPTSSRSNASKLLTKSNIIEAIEAKQQEYREMLQFSREKALRILVGMVEASLDDFTEIFNDPADKRNYRGLGQKRMALESAKKTVITQEDGSQKVTSEIRIITSAERRAALNDLWNKLGFDKTTSTRDRLAFFEQILGAVRGTPKQEPTE